MVAPICGKKQSSDLVRRMPIPRSPIDLGAMKRREQEAASRGGAGFPSTVPNRLRELDDLRDTAGDEQRRRADAVAPIDVETVQNERRLPTGDTHDHRKQSPARWESIARADVIQEGLLKQFLLAALVLHQRFGESMESLFEFVPPRGRWGLRASEGVAKDRRGR